MAGPLYCTVGNCSPPDLVGFVVSALLSAAAWMVLVLAVVFLCFKLYQMASKKPYTPADPVKSISRELFLTGLLIILGLFGLGVGPFAVDVRLEIPAFLVTLAALLVLIKDSSQSPL